MTSKPVTSPIYLLLSDFDSLEAPHNQKSHQEELELLNFIIDLQLPRVAIIEAGFRGIHAVMQSLNIAIHEHQRELCSICNPNTISVGGSAGKHRSKSKSFFERVADVFAFHDGDHQTTVDSGDRTHKRTINDRSALKQQETSAFKQQPQHKAQPPSTSIGQNMKQLQNKISQQTKATISEARTPKLPTPHLIETGPKRGEETLQDDEISTSVDTQSNCIGNEGDDSRRHIQESKFQVKHSASNRAVSPMHKHCKQLHALFFLS